MPVKTNEEIVSAIISGIESDMRDIALARQECLDEKPLQSEQNHLEKN